VKHHGTYETVLPSTLEGQIKASLVKKPREYLFMQANGSPYDHVASFAAHHNRFLKKTFGDNVSNNSLRHAKATHLNSRAGVTLGERRAVARAMGHGVEMNLAYSLQV
jgi:integrase